MKPILQKKSSYQRCRSSDRGAEWSRNYDWQFDARFQMRACIGQAERISGLRTQARTRWVCACHCRGPRRIGCSPHTRLDNPETGHVVYDSNVRYSGTQKIKNTRRSVTPQQVMAEDATKKLAEYERAEEQMKLERRLAALVAQALVRQAPVAHPKAGSPAAATAQAPQCALDREDEPPAGHEPRSTGRQRGAADNRTPPIVPADALNFARGPISVQGGRATPRSTSLPLILDAPEPLDGLASFCWTPRPFALKRPRLY